MGWYVHLSVVFACDNNDGPAAVAKDILASLPEEAPREAKWFLEEMARRTGGNPGPKGGLSTWGIVGNYTLGDEFVEALRPYWTELLKRDGDGGGPLDFEHILVFLEPEQSGAAQAYEISLDGETLRVVHHKDLPFCWNQY